MTGRKLCHYLYPCYWTEFFGASSEFIKHRINSLVRVVSFAIFQKFHKKCLEPKILFIENDEIYTLSGAYPNICRQVRVPNGKQKIFFLVRSLWTTYLTHAAKPIVWFIMKTVSVLNHCVKTECTPTSCNTVYLMQHRLPHATPAQLEGPSAGGSVLPSQWTCEQGSVRSLGKQHDTPTYVHMKQTLCASKINITAQALTGQGSAPLQVWNFEMWFFFFSYTQLHMKIAQQRHTLAQYRKRTPSWCTLRSMELYKWRRKARDWGYKR